MVEPIKEWDNPATAAFEEVASKRKEPKDLNAARIRKLEETLIGLSPALSKISDLEVRVFRNGELHVADDLDRDGSYHMTQSYVLGISRRGSDHYKSILFVRHSGGYLNNTNFRETPGHGRPYQSISVHDSEDFTGVRNGVNAVSFMTNDQFKAERINATPNYANFTGGDGDEAIQNLARGIAGYCANLATNENAYHSYATDKPSLQGFVEEVMVEHAGILTGSRPSWFAPSVNLTEIKAKGPSLWGQFMNIIAPSGQR